MIVAAVCAGIFYFVTEGLIKTLAPTFNFIYVPQALAILAFLLVVALIALAFRIFDVGV